VRLEQSPKVIQAMAGKAPVRFCKRFRYLMARGQKPNPVVVAIARARAAFIWAIAREVPITRYTPRPLTVNPHRLGDRRRPSDETPPRFGAILAGVKRLPETRGPRARQALDGHPSGGTQPTAISVSNRRHDWLLRCRGSGRKQDKTHFTRSLKNP
jgi:hypothetical protein